MVSAGPGPGQPQDSRRTVIRSATSALPCRTSRLRAETVLCFFQRPRQACALNTSCAQDGHVAQHTPAPAVSARAYQHSPLRVPVAATFLPVQTLWRVLNLLLLLLLVLPAAPCSRAGFALPAAGPTTAARAGITSCWLDSIQLGMMSPDALSCCRCIMLVALSSAHQCCCDFWTQNWAPDVMITPDGAEVTVYLRTSRRKRAAGDRGKQPGKRISQCLSVAK